MEKNNFVPKSDLPQMFGVARVTVYRWIKKLGGELREQYNKTRLLSPRLFAQIKAELGF
jgi:transposase